MRRRLPTGGHPCVTSCSPGERMADGGTCQPASCPRSSSCSTAAPASPRGCRRTCRALPASCWSTAARASRPGCRRRPARRASCRTATPAASRSSRPARAPQVDGRPRGHHVSRRSVRNRHVGGHPGGGQHPVRGPSVCGRKRLMEARPTRGPRSRTGSTTPSRARSSLWRPGLTRKTSASRRAGAALGPLPSHGGGRGGLVGGLRPSRSPKNRRAGPRSTASRSPGRRMASPRRARSGVLIEQVWVHEDGGPRHRRGGHNRTYQRSHRWLAHRADPAGGRVRHRLGRDDRGHCGPLHHARCARDVSGSVSASTTTRSHART